MPKFTMTEYTGVNDRMKLAADTWQSITVSPPHMLTDLAGYVTATVMLKDGRTVTEIAAFRLGLTGASAQANFPIEDAATSAVGRALGRFGFGTDANFPSREEMQQVERVSPPPPVVVQSQPTLSINERRARTINAIKNLWVQEEASGGDLTAQKAERDLGYLEDYSNEGLARLYYTVKARVDALPVQQQSLAA